MYWLLFYNEELPECIDKQLIEIKCEPFLEVKKIGNGLTEPILIVWPQITDNDPYFNIRPLNIPLVHQNIPILLPDNLTEIQWEVVDRHGINIKCFTKLKFLEEEKKKNNLESSPITISIELLPIWSNSTLNKNINCIKNLIKSIRPSLLKLIDQKCPNINWGSQSQFYNLTKIIQNFTTGIENTPSNLNKCIRLLEEFFVNSSMPLVPINLFNGECPNGPFSVQKHSFNYHSNCPDGWIFNKKILKCEEYPKIPNKSLSNFEVIDKDCKGFCKCNLGFTGMDCSIPLNLCNASYCLNGGKCLFDYLNGSKCFCLDDRNDEGVGTRKSEEKNTGNRNSDRPVPLDRQGSKGFPLIITHYTIFHCVSYSEIPFIKKGFNGTRCEINKKQEEDNIRTEYNLINVEEINKNNCQLNKCLNGGICSINNNENILSTKCLCPPNFEGNNCQIKKETKIEKCQRESWCGKNGYCKKLKEAKNYIFEEEIIFCGCNEGFFGEFCESKQNNNLKNNSCKCLNGGECIENNLCKCLIGFYGNKCQFKLNPCNLFNGLCVKEENYECNAYFNMSTGAIELLCKCGENNNNEGNYSCISQFNNLCINKNNFCKNGGECISFNSSIKCKCLNNYFGNNCEYLINYCSLPEICLNGGNCLNNSVDYKYFCECLNNGSGINCENSEENLFIDGDNSMDILENPCQQKPDYCNNAGECHLLPNSTHRYCKCLPPFTGIYCETSKFI
uniref:EGF-like domain-containing protein n=1 Tax=Meloidogyne incognita TaxID=6306 RepID=A0A914MXB3_MELIC